MDIPIPSLALLALPLAVAAVIVLVSAARRRRHAANRRGAQPVHRLQADTAAVQDAAVRPVIDARKVRSGRERRAASAAGPADG